MNKKIIYRIYNKYQLIDDNIHTLMLLYQPLLGITTVSLFFYLYSLESTTIIDFEYLKHLYCLNYNIETLLNKLQQANLIKRYQKDNEILIELQQLRSFNDLILDPIFSKLLVEEIKKETYLEYCHRFTLNNLDFNQYKDISTKVSFKYQSTTKTNQEIFKKTTNNSTFNLDELYQVMDTFCFPKKLRTKKLEKLILDYANLYTITYEDMKRILMACIDIDGNFNIRTFDLKIANLKPITKEVENQYLLQPITFLSNYQNGSIIVDSEIRLIQDLQNKIKLPNEVINVLLEYTLKATNNSLPKDYVEKIASTLKRSNIKTFQQALDYLYNKKQETKNYNKSNKFQILNFDDIKDPSEELTKEEIEELDNFIKGKK